MTPLSTLEQLCHDIGSRIGKAVGDKALFTLILWGRIGTRYGPFSTYISNADRRDMILALQEAIDKLKNDQTQPPGLGEIQPHG